VRLPIWRKKRIDVGYESKAAIINSFVDSAAGDLFFRMLNHFLRIVGWDTTDPDDIEKYEATYLKKFDDVVSYGWQFLYQKKGNKKLLVGTRKGAMPNRSALYLKEEMALIKLAMSPFFESLETLKKNFRDTILNFGIASVKSVISREYKKRHAILERFANATTRRLNQVREGLKNRSIKKKEITIEMVQTLLSTRLNPAEDFFAEIKSIIGSDNMSSVFAVFEKKSHSPRQGSVALFSEIIQIYDRMNLYGENLKRPQVEKLEVDEKYIRDLELAARLTRTMIGNAITTSNLLNKFCAQVTPEARGHIRGPLTNNILALADKLSGLVNIPPEVFNEVKLYQWEALGTIVGQDALADVLKGIQPIIDCLNQYKGGSKTLAKNDDASVASKVEEVRARLSGGVLFLQHG
jgi:hypothetical protein